MNVSCPICHYHKASMGPMFGWCPSCNHYFDPDEWGFVFEGQLYPDVSATTWNQALWEERFESTQLFSACFLEAWEPGTFLTIGEKCSDIEFLNSAQALSALQAAGVSFLD